ncbi:MAG: glycosyltransferase family 4 protein [Candidatus Latescibacterota bacterium]|nr:glycosyltransferase family 4 protein [Candidatus Latescibacterota bacterium]
MNGRGEKSLCFVGALPPPLHGQTVYTEMVLRSSELRERFDLLHLNTSDHRDLAQVGRLDLVNVYIGIKNVIQLCCFLWQRKVGVLYVPVSQNALAYLRDFLFLSLGRLFGTTIVIHIHGGYFWEFYRETNLAMRWIIRLSCSWVSRAIVLGEKFRPLLKDLVPSERVCVVSNGISIRTKKSGRKISESREEIWVTYLGNLMKAKGVLDIIQATTYFVDRAPAFRLKLAGPWFLDSEREEAEALLAANPLVRERTDFLGIVGPEDKDDLLRQSDIFVFPTQYPFEGQPLVLLEALAAGLPVVTTDHGCIPETIIHGENGFLVEKEDPHAIADSVLALMEDTDLRRRLGEANRRRFESHYTEEKSVRKLCDLLDEAFEDRFSK